MFLRKRTRTSENQQIGFIIIIIIMLSLFDTDSEDESLDGADTSPSEDDFVVKHIPMNEAISTVPASYAELLEVLLPRFQPHYNLKGISIEDQESLVKN